MDTYHEDTYGERIAGIYDEWYAQYDAATIETLKELARGGLVLELGIGTGRVALPLQQTGITVHGIDISPAMIDRLGSKADGDNIPVSLGNFADVGVDGQYALIYILFNTFFALLTQEEQVRCMRNVAQHLGRTRHFVVEAFVPDLTRFSGQQAFRVINVGEHEIRLDASQIDPVTQQINSQHIVLDEQGVRLYPVKLRYVWPAELDLMARLAGLRLANRWGDWQKAPFSAQSSKHISVYEPIP